MRFREIYPKKTNNCENLKRFVRTLQLIGQPYTIRQEKIVVGRRAALPLNFLLTNRDGVSY